MKRTGGHSSWGIVAGIAAEIGFAGGLTLSLCVLAYLVAALVR